MSRDDQSQVPEGQRRALLRQLAAARAAKRSVAIVGVDCRLPGAPNFAALRELLRDGVDAITEVPPERWKADEIYHPDFEHRGTVTTKWGGFIPDIDRFDAAFFGISPREAAVMDPQHRLLLTCAWHALEDAGLRRAQLEGSRTGVYLAQYQRDYARLALAELDGIDAYTASGTHHGIAANRLSYLLDLRGPSVVVDTACSSSLVALHLALRALRRGEIELAIVAGVNLMISPEETVALSRWGVMAADGRCKSFDHRADGFVRGEGVAVVVLARTEQAQSMGLRRRAELLGSAVNQDGRSNGLTAPNPLAQVEVLREALRDAKLEPEAVTMIEAHGTGTALGDPIEVEALAQVYGGGHGPCHLSSIKSKIGHLEAAAGLAGLLEALVCIETGQVAASLHIERPNPALPLAGSRLELARETRSWDAPRRIAGVSAFGMGGTNAHVLIAQIETQQSAADGDGQAGDGDEAREPARRFALLPLSAADPEALRRVAERWSAWLRAEPSREVQRVCAAAAHQRSALRCRLAVVGRSCSELADALERWLEQGAGRGAAGSPSPKLALLCPGQGGQWVGMGRALRRSEPAFAEALARCDEIIARHAGFSVLAELEHAQPRLDSIEIVQPLLFSLSVAYAALWRSVGLEPSALVGHSMGEAAAAVISGALSWEQGAWIIVERSRRMKRLAGRGGMMLVGLSSPELVAWLVDTQLELAAINGPRSCVVTGPHADLDALGARLEREHAQLELRRIDVEVASHHAGMDELAEELRASFAELEPRASEWPLYSTVEARALTGEELDADYWFRNLRQPVQLWAVIEQLRAQGVRDFIELGPHPVLLPALREELDEGDATIPCGRRGQDEERSWLEALASAWTRGHALELGARTPRPRGDLELPAYPFDEQRHWLEGVRRSRRGRGRTSALPPDLEAWSHELAWVPVSAEPSAAEPQLPDCLVLGRGALAEAMVAAGLGARASAPAQWQGAKVGATRLLVPVGELGEPPEGEPAPCESRRLALEADALGALLRSLEATGAGIELWLLTRGGGPGLAQRDPFAAACLGLARVAGIEHEQLCRGIIDLDPESSLEAFASLARSRELPEQLLALRGDRVLGLRLRPRPLPRCAPLELEPGKAYAVVGGFGGLGRHMCRWLADAGARHVVIFSRTPVPERRLWSSSDDARISLVLELEERGVCVYVQDLDVANKTMLSRFLDEWTKSLRPKIGGVIHAAGTQEHSAIVDREGGAFEAAAAAKIEGSRALLELLGELDFLVLCSSAASMLRSPLLGSYVAASSYQDALAESWRARGRAVTAIGWGLWPEGMSARYRARTGRSAPGFEPMDPSGALACMERALSAGLGHCGVMRVDWSRWAASHSHEASAPLMRALVEARRGRDAGVEFARASFVEASRERRVELLLAYLAARVAAVAGLRTGQIDVERGAAAHGLDSLMAVELRNRMLVELGLSCSIVAVLRSESLVALAQTLASEFEAELEEQEGDWETETI